MSQGKSFAAAKKSLTVQHMGVVETPNTIEFLQPVVLEKSHLFFQQGIRQTLSEVKK